MSGDGLHEELLLELAWAAFSRAMISAPRYFASIETAELWVGDFVTWYNTQHRHSAIRFVTPEQRHSGRDIAILARRRETYQEARARHPERWTGETRTLEPCRGGDTQPRHRRCMTSAQAATMLTPAGEYRQVHWAGNRHNRLWIINIDTEERSLPLNSGSSRDEDRS